MINAAQCAASDCLNYIVRRDPDRFIGLYQQAHAEAREVSQLKKSKSALETQLAGLCEKYRFNIDFDILETRDHVLYEDSVAGNHLKKSRLPI